MTAKTGTFALRLPLSLKAAIEKAAEADGTSMNQFLVVAAAEKLSALQTEAYFAERRARSDSSEFLRILNREGGERPREDDEMPEDLAGKTQPANLYAAIRGIVEPLGGIDLEIPAREPAREPPRFE